jgi:type IV pilus assembly protein PilC
LRQFEQLAAAGVADELALNISNADARSGDRKADTPTASTDLLKEFPGLRNRFSGLPESDRTVLLGAAAEVLDSPYSSGGGKTIAIVSLVVTCVVLLMFATFVFPTFKDLFESFGADLPGPTRLAMFIAEWLLLPLGLVLMAILGADYLASHLPGRAAGFAWRIDMLKERYALIKRQRQVESTRILAGWLAATRGRLDDRESVESLQELLARQRMSRQLDVLKTSMAGGKPLSKALTETSAWLPGLAMLLAEEATDAAALLAYAESLDVNMDVVSGKLLLVSQLALGAILGFFVIAMYLPIFKMGAAI